MSSALEVAGLSARSGVGSGIAVDSASIAHGTTLHSGAWEYSEFSVTESRLQKTLWVESLVFQCVYATFISEASMLLLEHVAFHPRMANVDWRKGWAESLKVLAVG